CFARAAVPPPCSTAATFALKSATSAAIASRFAAKVASRGSSFDSSTGMDASRSSVPLEHREPRREQHEERADRAGEPARSGAMGADPAPCARRDPRDRDVDEEAVEVEEA